MQYLIRKAPLRQPFEKMWRRSEAREKINRRRIFDTLRIKFFAATREIPTYFQKKKKIAGMPLRCYNPQYEHSTETADRRTEF